MPPQELNNQRAPAIDEIVGLLNRHRPGALAELRNRYPNQTDLLRVGTIAGETEGGIDIRVNTAIVGLSTAIEICNERIPAIRDRIAMAQRWQFTGQAFSLVGGASIFAAISADFPKLAQYGVAALTLLGSLASLYAQYNSGAMQGSAKNLIQINEQLIDSRFEALQTKQELELTAQATGEVAAKSKLIRRANAICFTIVRAEGKVPWAVAKLRRVPSTSELT